MGKKVIDGNLQVTGTITTSTPVENAEVTTKEYVDSNLQDIMEVAEGKCSTFVVGYNKTVADIKAYTVYDLDGNNITDAVRAGDYDSVILGNPGFNSQSASIDLDIGTYLIIESAYISSRQSTVNDYVLVSIEDLLLKLNGHLGDIFLVSEVDVPDRWVSGMNSYSGSITLKILETTKVDLTNYYTKNASIIPSVGNSYDLGSSSYSFKDGYLKGRINFIYNSDTWFISNMNGAFDIGYGISNKKVEIGLTNATFDTNLLPWSTNTRDLGSSSLAWKNLYLSGAVKGSTELDVYLNGSQKYKFESSCFRPIENGAVSLGKADRKWQNLYLSGAIYGANYDTNVDYLIGSALNISTSSTDSEIRWSKLLTFSKSANTTFTFETAKGGCLNEYKAIITNTANSAIILTFTRITHILTNDDNIAVSNGTNSTITLPSGVSVECSFLASKGVIINFDVA